MNKTDAVSEETIRLVEQTTQMITSAFRALETCSEPIAFENITDALAENCYNPRTGKNQIVLNKGEFSNPEKLLDKLQFDFANGYSYETDTIESLVAHEMGHNAHIALALKRAGLQYGQPLSVIELRLFEEQYKKVSQDIYLYVFENESYDEIQSACIQQLGSMVAHNPNELIAQSFGNYYFGKTKSDIAAKVIKFFRKEL